jgi:predicted lipoprotein with Yx(FWY)xxD motif
MLIPTSARVVAPVAAIALLVAACQAAPQDAPDVTPGPTAVETPSPDPPDPTEAPTEEPEEATVDGPQLEVASAAGIGDYVVDEDGFTLYVFLDDSPGTSNCTDQCAAAWPPLIVEEGEEPGAPGEVTAELGTITRDDGSVQVTLDGWPLYYYGPDVEPGDTNGEGVGDIWFVARPDGSLPSQGSSVDDY